MLDAQYDAAATNDTKMNVVGREYWLSLFGNGTEVLQPVQKNWKAKSYAARIGI